MSGMKLLATILLLGGIGMAETRKISPLTDIEKSALRVSNSRIADLQGFLKDAEQKQQKLLAAITTSHDMDSRSEVVGDYLLFDPNRSVAITYPLQTGCYWPYGYGGVITGNDGLLSSPITTTTYPDLGGYNR